MLQGKLSAPATLGGALKGGAGLQGTLAGGGSIHPVYDGPVEFEPSEDAQTIGTEGKVVPTDLTVDAIPSGYVGSAVDRRDSDDLAASGATVTAPAGYYAEPASKAVASGSITMRRPTMDEAVGEIRSRADLTTGYITGGSYSGSALILDKQAGTTITPTESEQVAVAQYRWTTGDVKVAAIPGQYIVPAGTYTVTGSGTHDVAEYASASVASATPTNSSESEYITSSGSRKWRYRPKTIVPTAGWAAQRSASNPINGFWTTYDAIPTGTTVTPTTSAQTIGGADTMMEGAVTVAAIPPEYIVPSGTKAISANGEGIDVAAYSTVDVAVASQESTFVITLSWNSTSEMWEPDCTYAQLSSAVSAGKRITIEVPSEELVGANCAWSTEEACLYYVVFQTDSAEWTESVYVFGSGGLDVNYIDTISRPSGTINITASGNTDVTQYATASVPNADWDSGTPVTSYTTQGGQRKWRIQPNFEVFTAGWISTGTKSGTIKTFDALASGTTITPSTSAQTVGGADVMMEGAVTVAAMPTGTAGTPSATKGTVSNHSVSVTPSVTNSTGYITGGTKTGTAVSVSASELVSGSETKTANGTYDVTNLAELVVNVSGGGSSVKTATGTFTGNGTRTIDVACTFEPDIVYFTSNPGTTASSGTVAAIIVRDMMTATRYRNNSTTNSHYAIPDIANLNTSGSSYSWRATYANSKVTLYCYSNNVRGLLTGGRTYTYTFIKWT